MFKKLLCKLGRHDPIRQIDKIDLVSVSPFSGPMFNIVEEHKECYRCKKVLSA